MQRNPSFRGKGEAQLAQPQMIIGREREEKEEAESENRESHLDLMCLRVARLHVRFAGFH